MIDRRSTSRPVQMPETSFTSGVILITRIRSTMPYVAVTVAPAQEARKSAPICSLWEQSYRLPASIRPTKTRSWFLIISIFIVKATINRFPTEIMYNIFHAGRVTGADSTTQFSNSVRHTHLFFFRLSRVESFLRAVNGSRNSRSLPRRCIYMYCTTVSSPQ